MESKEIEDWAVLYAEQRPVVPSAPERVLGQAPAATEHSKRWEAPTP